MTREIVSPLLGASAEIGLQGIQAAISNAQLDSAFNHALKTRVETGSVPQGMQINLINQSELTHHHQAIFEQSLPWKNETNPETALIRAGQILVMANLLFGEQARARLTKKQANKLWLMAEGAATYIAPIFVAHLPQIINNLEHAVNFFEKIGPAIEISTIVLAAFIQIKSAYWNHQYADHEKRVKHSAKSKASAPAMPAKMSTNDLEKALAETIAAANVKINNLRREGRKTAPYLDAKLQVAGIDIDNERREQGAFVILPHLVTNKKSQYSLNDFTELNRLKGAPVPLEFPDSMKKSLERIAPRLSDLLLKRQHRRHRQKPKT
ncbi:MAG: hypothetical protein Q8P47_00215 [Candidatus Beckwithbacteria bacterium]|nr:hypothetical protein [Candidatus Beckwithbacteria bacterium]